MKQTFTTCSPSSRRAGLTLIEVVAAIAILGTVLVSTVIAKSLHTRQLALAQRQQLAVRAADELISKWWASSTGIPIGEQGVMDGELKLRWETRVVANAAIRSWGARVVRVEFRSTEPALTAHEGRTDEPLVAVELVLPDPELEEKRSPEIDSRGGTP